MLNCTSGFLHLREKGSGKFQKLNSFYAGYLDKSIQENVHSYLPVTLIRRLLILLHLEGL